jgi:predicted amidophosphoribosyltransferase
MNAINASFGLFVALFTIVLLFYSLRKLKPQLARYGTQRICPSCGLITSRLKACCLECGKSLTPVVYSVAKK